jgi:hypothetical protein
LLTALAIILHLVIAGRSNVNYYDMSQLIQSKHDGIVFDNTSVTMIPHDENINVSAKDFIITIKNNSDHKVTYGESHTLETFINGEWHTVPVKENHFFPLIMLWVNAHSERGYKICLDMFECYPGKHRIVKQFNLEIPPLKNGIVNKTELMFSLILIYTEHYGNPCLKIGDGINSAKYF